MSNTLQFSALGLEDYYLSRNPASSFLLPEYQQHQNFSKKSIEIRSNEKINFSRGDGRSYTFQIPKAGHFLHRLYFHVKVPALTPTSGTYASWTNSFMYALAESIKLEIGGMTVDMTTGTAMEIENELTINPNPYNGVNMMVGKEESILSIPYNALTPREFILPLDFWFSRDIRNSLPMSLLTYQNVKMSFKLRSFLDCIVYDGSTPPLEVAIQDAYMSGEYIFIEKDIMKNFAEKTINGGISYLVEQHCVLKEETIPVGITNYRARIEFSHPVKELYWVLVEEDSLDNSDWFNYSRRDDTLPPMIKAKINIDGIDQSNDYLSEAHFRLLEPQKYHSNIPRKYINVYSFSLHPEQLDPSGTLNFSAVSSVEIFLLLNTGNKKSRFYLFGKNYNIFTVANGQGILKFYP